MKNLNQQSKNLRSMHNYGTFVIVYLCHNRRSCASVDARKMYGDLTPGDTTHKDVIREYEDYFKKTFRHLPKELKQSTSTEEKYKIWKMTSDIVQVYIMHICMCQAALAASYRFIASLQHNYSLLNEN